MASHYASAIRNGSAPQAGIEPIDSAGHRRDHVVAFMSGESVITIVPRLVAKLGGDWRDTEVDLPNGAWTII